MTNIATLVDQVCVLILSQLGLMAIAGSLLALLSLIWLRRWPSSASTRHRVWLLSVIAPLSIPIASELLPNWEVRLPFSSTLVTFADTPALSNAPAPKGSKLPTTPSTPAVPKTETRTTPPALWPPILVAIWASIASIRLAWWIVGAISLRRLARRCERMDASMFLDLVESTKAKLGMKKQIQLYMSSERETPMQWGMWRPKVLLPMESSRWQPERIRTVLLHELAHVARADCVTRAVAHFVTSILWFNPVSHLAYRRLVSECELACDDIALKSGCDPFAYADTLLDVSRLRQKQTSKLTPALGMATTSLLEGRVRAILSPQNDRSAVSIRASILSLLISGSIISLVAVLRPKFASAQSVRSTVTKTDATDSPTVSTISYVDNSAEGVQSIAGSGHAVRFNVANKSRRNLVAVEIYASRYGTPTAPDEDFHLYLLDSKRKLIKAFPIPYQTIARGRQRWYTISLEATKVPKEFYVAFAFNPHRTKGIYVGYDESVKQSRSLVGRPTSGWRTLEGRNWMIRAVTSEHRVPPNPFD